MLSYCNENKCTNSRGFLTSPNSWAPHILPPFIFKYCPTHPKPLSPLLFLLPALFPLLNGWSRQIWCVVLLNDIMDLRLASLGILIPEEPCCAFYTKGIIATKVWHMMSFFVITLIWYHTHKERHTIYRRGKRLIHPYKLYIITNC